jgi:hypothetical protein
MASRFRSRPLEVSAIQFAGTNLSEMRALIPPGAGKLETAYREPVLILRCPDRPVRLVHEGDWLSWDGERVTVHSDVSFGRFWEKTT